MHVIGVDLGGTNIKTALVDTASGKATAVKSMPTGAEDGPSAVIERMAKQIRRARAGAPKPGEICAVGIGVPGLYDPATNHTRFLPNLPTEWRGVPLGPKIEACAGLPAVLVNDARAFTLAEAKFGGGQGASRVVGMTLGTGIGGGLFLDGRLVFGHDGTAGEVGHQVVDPFGPHCGCGSRGCLEAFVSGPAIAAMGMKAVRQGRTTLLRDLCAGDLDGITPEIIVEAARKEDPVASEILAEAGFYLGIGVANLVTLFSPDVVVIGGGVATAGEWLLRPVREVVRERCRVTPIERVRVEQALLGSQAGVIGAALWAAETMVNKGEGLI